MASPSSKKGKVVIERGVETPVASGGGDTTKRSGGLVRAFFIKNVRDGDGNWLTNEMKSNLSLISKRLTEVP